MEVISHASKGQFRGRCPGRCPLGLHTCAASILMSHNGEAPLDWTSELFIFLPLNREQIKLEQARNEVQVAGNTRCAQN